MATFMWINIHFWSYLPQLFLELEMFQKKYVDKIKKTFMSKKLHFQSLTAYEIAWKI